MFTNFPNEQESNTLNRHFDVTPKKNQSATTSTSPASTSTTPIPNHNMDTKCDKQKVLNQENNNANGSHIDTTDNANTSTDYRSMLDDDNDDALLELDF